MADWDVVYRALADFTDLNREAAKAEATLKQLQEAAKAEGQAEETAALKAAAAHDADTLAIKRQQQAMEKATIAAAAYNKEVNHGGSSSADSHLSQLQRERDLVTQLERAKQRGFYSPQQNYSFRQQEMQQQLLWNRAIQQGYASPDQYLAYLQRERTAMQNENQEWSKRAILLDGATAAATTHADALAQTHASAQDLGRTGVDNISAFSSAVGQLDGQTATVKARVDTKPALADITAIRAAIRQLSDDTANPKVEMDSKQFLAQAVLIRSAMDDLNKKTEKLDIQPKGLSEAQQDFTRLQQQGSSAFKDIEASATRSDESLKGRFRDIGSYGGQVWRSVSQSAKQSAADSESAFGQALEAIKGGFQGLSSSGSGLNLISSIGQAGSAFGSASGSVTLITGAIGALVSLLPSLVAGLDAVVSVLFVMPALLTAAAGAFGVYASAIQPVLQAFGAYMKLLDAQQSAQANSVQTTMQVAQQQTSLADAYFAVQEAAYQAGQTQITDAHNIAEAQFALSQAVFNAGIVQQQSAMQVASAEHDLQQANFNVTQSQYQLTLAWQQAQESLASLELQVSDASVNLRGAQLGLAEAQQNYAMVMANANSTALDRAQAAYQIQAAEEALQQVELQNTANETQLNDVRQFGMQQVFGVTQAQNALTNAQFEQVQATKQLSITQKEAANAQVQAAHAVKDAVFQLQQAFRQQANDALVSAHNQADAQAALQQALLQSKLGVGGVASAQEALNTALSQLGPVAQQALKYLQPLAYWWNNVFTVQNAFWKQLLPALANLKGIIGPVNDFLVAAAKASGTVAANFLTWFENLAKSPLWKVLTNSTSTTILQIGTAFLKVADGVVKLLAAAAPFTGWFLDGVVKLADKFDTWATNADKPGSTFKKWLDEIKPVLHDVSGLFGSILDFFTNFGTQQNLTIFGNFVNALASVVIPDLTAILQALGNPTVANAVIQLMVATANLITTIVTSPGFISALSFMVTAFSKIALAAEWLLKLPGVGPIIGGIAGGLVAISLLKFTGVFALAGKIKDIADYMTTIKNASGVWGTIKAVFGSKAGNTTDTTGVVAGAEKAAPILSEAIVAGAKEAAPILAGGEESGGAVAASDISGAEAAGSVGSSAGSAAGAAGAGAGAAGAEGAVAGGLAGFLGRSVVVAAIAGAVVLIIRSLGSLVPKPPGPTQFGSRQTAADVKNTPGAALDVTNFLHLTNVGAWIDQYFSQPLRKFFTTTVPGIINGTAGASWWKSINASWVNDVQNPLQNFFTKDLQQWFLDATNWATNAWQAIGGLWNQYIWSPVSNFFTHDLQQWFVTDVGNWAGQAWIDVSNLFTQHIINPLQTFWTKTLPGWLTGLPDWFNTHVIEPIEGFFTHSLPTTIENAFKDSVNWVITNVVNKAIGFINAVTGVVGAPKIKPVSLLASGGHVAGFSGTGSEDDVDARLTAGEWVINRNARNAIDREYGPDFLYYLNSMQGYAAGGSVTAGPGNPSAGSASGSGSSILGDVLGFFKSAFGQTLSGLGSLLGKPAQAVFDLVWSKGVQPLIQRVAGDGVPGVLADSGLGVIKTAIDKLLAAFVPAPVGGTGGAGGAGVPGPGGGAPSANAALAQRMMPAWGSGAEWAAWNDLEMREAGWNQYARNPSSGAYGIPQALPPSKMGAAANPPQSNVAAQISWMIGYIRGRYGDPINADAHERAFHWYAQGGPVGMASGGSVPSQIAAIEQAEASQVHAYGGVRQILTAKDQKAISVFQNNLVKAYNALNADKTTPAKLTNALWAALSTAGSKEVANVISTSTYTAERKKFPKQFSALVSALNTMNSDVTQGQTWWEATYGGGSGGGVGGGGTGSPLGAPVTFPGMMPYTGPGTVGPALALIPSGPGPGYGGFVEGRAAGGLVGGPLRSPFAGGLQFRIGSQHNSYPTSFGGGWGRNAGPPDRLVGDAARSAGVPGLAIGDVHIHNPVPEKAGDSLTRSVQRLSFLAGRGVA